ncbi:hypothetical protein CLOP_g5168 [Closterium sp. NIES-67]|nr:hypothetical protein CLOP_g5168 [Closterium sp. NIES-67]
MSSARLSIRSTFSPTPDPYFPRPLSSSSGSGTASSRLSRGGQANLGLPRDRRWLVPAGARGASHGGLAEGRTGRRGGREERLRTGGIRGRKTRLVARIAAGTAGGGGGESIESRAGESEAVGVRDEDVSFLRAASTVGIAAAASKILGLIREMVLAAAFGVGPVMTAFSYSALIPTFCLSLLGGVNGPFHSAIASALSKSAAEKGRNAEREQQELLAVVSALVALASIAAAMLVFLFARHIIDLLAPGLSLPPPGGFITDSSSASASAVTRHIAISQLQQMAPCIALAPLIGIGFGTLSARGEFAIPSLSPSLSSLSVLAGISSYFALCRWSPLASPQREMIGGACLAVAAEIRSAPSSQPLAAAATPAAAAQTAQQQQPPPTPPAPPAPASSPPVDSTRSEASQEPPAASWLPLDALFARHRERLHEIFAVLLPATVASGMLQIATFTDLFFASFLPGTAAALGYANLLVMAPLGILSSALLVPLLPLFARLAHPKDRALLKDSLRRGLVMTMAVTLPMTAVMLPLARPIVRVVFQRRSFDASATTLVSSLLSCYLLGSPCYLARDVLVRLFYSLSDGATPFLISTFAIAANAVLDFLFVHCWAFGPQGLVLATAAVNSASAVVLLWLAHRRMGGLPLSLWWPSFSILLQAAAATAATVTATHALLSAALTAASHSLCFHPRWVWFLDAAAVGTAAGAGFLVFCALVVAMRLPEAMPLWARVKLLLQKYGIVKVRTIP